MKRIFSFVSFIFLTCFVSSFGQNLSEIKEKYGQPIEAYSVSEHIWMTPKFTSDGQVCSMRLYPKRFSSDTVYLGDILNKWELEDFIRTIAPPETRGLKSKLSGLMIFAGHSFATNYVYENISFHFVTSLKMPIRIESSKSKKARSAKSSPNKPTPSGEFQNADGAKILTINWRNKRACDDKSKID
jgi:hypothetical protein